ncbi:MAG: helix-turn-helix transcriptional regulator [Ruminococcaceae bacterium]|nr:helix-turn-helix transcriptional regulator [Oscillospiraceae bacterium]
MIYSAYQDTDKGIAGVSVVSSGHIFAWQNRRIHRPNGRSDYLLFYVQKGSENIYLESETMLTEGGFIIFRPFEKQSHIQNESGISEFYYVHFNAPADFDLFGFESSVAYYAKPSTKIKDLFEEIIHELQLKQPAYEKNCVAKLFSIFSLLERNCAKELNPYGQYLDRISFVIQKINREYEKNYSLEDYANMCYMGKFHFLRIFKNITGSSPIEYRNNIRLEHAKELLTDTDSSIDEISRNLGYNSNVYFCNAFKAKTGMSPSQYRKTHR